MTTFTLTTQMFGCINPVVLQKRHVQKWEWNVTPLHSFSSVGFQSFVCVSCCAVSGSLRGMYLLSWSGPTIELKGGVCCIRKNHAYEHYETARVCQHKHVRAKTDTMSRLLRQTSEDLVTTWKDTQKDRSTKTDRQTEKTHGWTWQADRQPEKTQSGRQSCPKCYLFCCSCQRRKKGQTLSPKRHGPSPILVDPGLCVAEESNCWGVNMDTPHKDKENNFRPGKAGGRPPWQEDVEWQESRGYVCLSRAAAPPDLRTIRGTHRWPDVAPKGF